MRDGGVHQIFDGCRQQQYLPSRDDVTRRGAKVMTSSSCAYRYSRSTGDVEPPPLRQLRSRCCTSGIVIQGIGVGHGWIFDPLLPCRQVEY